MAKKPKRPPDIDQLAEKMVDLAAGEIEETKTLLQAGGGKNAAAAALERLGGFKGSKARTRSRRRK